MSQLVYFLFIVCNYVDENSCIINGKVGECVVLHNNCDNAVSLNSNERTYQCNALLRYSWPGGNQEQYQKWVGNLMVNHRYP